MQHGVGKNPASAGSPLGPLAGTPTGAPVARKGTAPGAVPGLAAAGLEAAAPPLERPLRYAPPWRVWLPIPILLLALDLTFNFVFWRIPKLTGPAADWGYQFLIDLHQARQPKAAEATRVVAFGSSVSGSFDPGQVAGLLAAGAGRRPEVHRLMLPGVHPADYRLLWQGERERIQPDVAVVLFNLLDFLSSSDDKHMNPTLLAALPAWTVLSERAARLSTGEKLDWAVRGGSNLYRYSKAIRSSLQDHLKLAPQLLRQRAPLRPYGVYADGYTRPAFAIPAAPGARFELEYFIDPEWIAQRGQVGLSFSAGGQPLHEVVEHEPGWKRVAVQMPASGGDALEVIADGFWNQRAAGGDDLRLLGVRLRAPFPAAADGRRNVLRYPPFQPGAVHELLRMGGSTGDEFVRRWDEVLNADNEFGRRFRIYRDEKLAIRNRPFVASGEYAEMVRLVTDLSRHGTRVVLVNTPDSPWLLREYQDSAYYAGYLQFFHDLAKQLPNVQFTDLRQALPVEDFNDWHHPSYIGSIKLGPMYAAAVRRAMDGPGH